MQGKENLPTEDFMEVMPTRPSPESEAQEPKREKEVCTWMVRIDSDINEGEPCFLSFQENYEYILEEQDMIDVSLVTLTFSQRRKSLKISARLEKN